MSRHFRRYCFYLADRLKMTVKQLLNELDSGEIAEWMAYDKTCDPKWLEKYNKAQELERSKQMTAEEKLKIFKQIFKGAPDNGNSSKPGRRDRSKHKESR